MENSNITSRPESILSIQSRRDSFKPNRHNQQGQSRRESLVPGQTRRGSFPVLPLMNLTFLVVVVQMKRSYFYCNTD